MTTLSINLYRVMSDNGITRKQLSKLTGISYNTICDYFNDKSYPSRNNLRKLADTLGVTEAELRGDSDSPTKIPVLGSIPAGIPLEAIEDIVDYEDVSPAMLRGGREYFGLRIKGDSMYPDFKSGDTVIFKKTPTADSGNLVAVMVNGYDATFKRLLIKGDSIILQPLNNVYEPLVFSREDSTVKVIGVAVEVRRKL